MAKEFVGQEYTAATHGKGLHDKSKPRRLITKITIGVSVAVVFISIAVFAACLLLILSPIRGTSMMTTLNATGKDTDSAISCSVLAPKRGDIVIYKLYFQDTHYAKQASSYETDAAGNLITDKKGNYVLTANMQSTYPFHDANGNYMYIIKRLIATEGDVISMERIAHPEVTHPTDSDYDYYIYLNGVKLNEDYLDPSVGHPSSINFIQLWHVLYGPAEYQIKDWCATDYNTCVDLTNHTLTIPEGYRFLLGDNRDGFREGNIHHGSSWDSAYFGPQSIKNCEGTCIDVISNKTTLPAYFWQKTVYYVFFGWLWQKK